MLLLARSPLHHHADIAVRGSFRQSLRMTGRMPLATVLSRRTESLDEKVKDAEEVLSLPQEKEGHHPVLHHHPQHLHLRKQ